MKNNEQQELNQAAFRQGFLLHIGIDKCELVKLCESNKEPYQALVFKNGLPAVKAWLDEVKK